MWEQYHRQMRLFELQESLDELLADVQSPNILEAGCGSASSLRFKPGSRLVGIDTSQEQLDRNEMISEKILGDLHTYDLSGRNFDAIICCFVLEHLDDPEKVVMNFVRGLSSRGVIVIVAPNLYSITGPITKFTPLWVHVLVRRVLLADKRTGKAGVGPFPTPYRLAMTPRRLKLLAGRNGMKIHYFRMYEAFAVWSLRRRSKLVRIGCGMAQLMVKAVTLGKVDIMLGTYAVIMGKGSTTAEDVHGRHGRRRDG